MTTRTFKQMGVAYGTQDLEITAKVDNVVVYQGTVVTLNEPMPSDLSFSVTNELFSWTADIDFSGTQVIEITVSNGTAQLLIADLKANYSWLQGNTANTYVSSGPNNYVTFTWEPFGNTYINGTLVDSQTIDHTILKGMWWWQLSPGDQFIENVTVNPGAPTPPA
jgi:hypothetical protein